MTDFANPFSGNIPDRKMSREELIRALRLDLASEEEAVNLYLAHADATDDPLAKAVLRDIAEEERVHVGEFQRLISLIDAGEDALLREGAREVDEIAEKIGTAPVKDHGACGAATIGSLRTA
jgi:rubrerythrin